MHSLTIVFGPSPVPWVLLYRDLAKAEEAYLHIQSVAAGKAGVTGYAGVALTLMDDFGQQIYLVAKDIHGVMLEDMDLSKMAHVEQGLHRARTQAKAQQMAAGDPILRTAAMAQGPAMLQPGFGNGAFRGQ